MKRLPRASIRKPWWRRLLSWLRVRRIKPIALPSTRRSLSESIIVRNEVVFSMELNYGRHRPVPTTLPGLGERVLK